MGWGLGGIYWKLTLWDGQGRACRDYARFGGRRSEGIGVRAWKLGLWGGVSV
jgi:hypothetical protein